MSDFKLSIGTLGFSGTEHQREALETIKAAGIKEIDTAHMYGGGQNEVDIGNAGAAELGLAISTKNIGGWAAGQGTALLPENLLRTARESLEKLKVKQIDIFYIHGPDRTLKLEQWVPSIDQLYKEGVFRRFGVSNFSPQEVRDLHDYSKAHGFVLPSVFQGNYNAVARKIEATLFPTLRELGIAFYAYSPLAGGFLAKTRETLEQGTRFGQDGEAIQKMYRGLYYKPTILAGLDKWGVIAEKEGISRSDLAVRWIYYHSSLDQKKGDVLILGASKLNHITSSVDSLKHGPLKPESVKAIDEIWESVKDEAGLDNFSG